MSRAAEDEPALRAPKVRFEVVAPFAASTLYALDAATGAPHRSSGYEAWIFGDETKEPSWVEPYRAHWQKWNTQVVDADGAHVPARVCSYESGSIGALLECMRPHASAEAWSSIEPALRAAEQRMRPRWKSLEPALQRLASELKVQLSSPTVEALLQELAAATKLPPDARLVFDVVLVAKPKGRSSRAHHEGRYLVLEVDETTEAIAKTDIALHELAHLASEHAPDREELEAAFADHGLEGLIAGNLWYEAFATAFGNGLAIRALAPEATLAPANMYADEAIGALGHALFQRWHAGTKPRLDASFAPLMVDIVREGWPRANWRWRDFLNRMSAWSLSEKSLHALAAAIGPGSFEGRLDLPSALDSAADPLPVPRVVMATSSQLRTHPAVLDAIGLSLAEVERVTSGGASIFWRERTGTTPVVLVTAPDEAALVDGLSRLEDRRLDAPGWSAL